MSSLQTTYQIVLGLTHWTAFSFLSTLPLLEISPSLMDLDDIAMPITPKCPPLANSPLENSTLVYATDYLAFLHGHQRSISNLKPKVELQYSPQSDCRPAFLISVSSTYTLPVLKSKPSE